MPHDSSVRLLMFCSLLVSVVRFYCYLLISAWKTTTNMDAREERRDRSRSNSSASSGRPGAYDSPPRSHVNSEDEAENYRDDGEYDSDGDTEVEDNGEPDGNIVNRWAVFNAMPVRRQEDSSGSSDADDSDDDDVEDSDGGSSDGDSNDGESSDDESRDGESSDGDSRSDGSSREDSDGPDPRINRSASQERLNDKLMIRHLREEIRKTKRRLDSAYLDLEESEYYYRREKEAKLDLERRVRSLEKEKQEYELDFSSMNCELTMAEADNKFLTHENEMLSDLAQQYFHSKEQQIKYKDRAKRQLRKRKKECKDLETEISQIANADEYRRTIEYERNRADGYQNLMQHIHLMYQNDEQLRREQDPSPLRSCEICLQKYMAVGRAVPRILVKCGHTLCHKCVESLRPQEPEGVRCPFCRTLTKISRRKGIESLPKNFTLVS
ncbi:hypothetical protein L3Y34_018000 [Caenorhabditis briggsae]|uniref:RING-type domain-containing protein n=2 Tax=Caenorhabditis briggsae TaxID=6238 RepID=A0AAE9DKJ0_CAEBR|nr:hypothetical protein L3Y34_018000 [Caenorhabditis briggsae]